MFFNIIYNIIISIIVIFITHSIFDYLKNTLTAPKIKDLIHKPRNEYEKINNLINSENNRDLNQQNTNTAINNNTIDTNNNSNSVEGKIDSENIKAELKDFFNELNSKKNGMEVVEYDNFNMSNNTF